MHPSPTCIVSGKYDGCFERPTPSILRLKEYQRNPLIAYADFFQSSWHVLYPELIGACIFIEHVPPLRLALHGAVVLISFTRFPSENR